LHYEGNDRASRVIHRSPDEVVGFGRSRAVMAAVLIDDQHRRTARGWQSSHALRQTRSTGRLLSPTQWAEPVRS
jgi:hypothetical protein